ncbi:ABC transporter substrate-binding protein [Anaerocolumna jejuensis]|uniref:ABC transporter substrate-binding protein n=1 Tax=Anaerocolumna jejuensis TaxID=259063 RepID=UPI003F7B7338
MKMSIYSKKLFCMVLTGTLAFTMLSGCGKNSSGGNNANDGSKSPEATAEAGKTVNIMGKEINVNDISGSITVLTNDTSSEDLFSKYEEEFKALYPKVKSVEFEAIDDYDNNCKIRLNAGEYPDVIYNPNLPASEYADYFAEMGATDTLKSTFTFAEKGSYSGKVYMLPAQGDVSGIEYNKAVFAQAGITEWPQSIEEFIKDLQLIKEKTSAIPWYTNYNAGWPLNQLKGNEAVIANDPGYRYKTLPHDKAPFSAGKPNYELYKFLYDVTSLGLIEKDPVTTDWDKSLQMLADGEIACMGLGSWAISSIQALAKNPEDIGFMPWPTGSNTVMLNAGYGLAVNKDCKNPDTAKAFIQWFICDSGYAQTKGEVSGQVNGKLPDNLSELSDEGTKFITELPATQGEEGLTDAICDQSEVGLYTEKFGRRIIDTALGKSLEGFKSYDDICSQMNEDWAAAQQKVFSDHGITQ